MTASRVKSSGCPKYSAACSTFIARTQETSYAVCRRYRRHNFILTVYYALLRHKGGVVKIFRLILLALFIGSPSSYLYAACTPDATTLCLQGGRFEVKADLRDEVGNQFTIPDMNQSGPAQAQPLFDDTGLFWFFEAANPEILAKVLDACSFNNHFWVFTAAPTNMEYTLTVTDTVSGELKQYFNPLGTPAPAITDTAAFATCNAVTQTKHSAALTTATGEPEKALMSGTCVADASTLCLQNNRFSVQINWEDFNANTGFAQPVPLSDQSGYFWFFSPNNVELLIKVLDGTAVNGHVWVFFAATTNVFYNVTVTDTLSGATRQYQNPLGTSSPAVLDNQAFQSIGVPIPIAGPQSIPTLQPISLLVMIFIMMLMLVWKCWGTRIALSINRK